MTFRAKQAPASEARLVEVIDTRVDEVRADPELQHEQDLFLAMIVEFGQLDREKSPGGRRLPKIQLNEMTAPACVSAPVGSEGLHWQDSEMPNVQRAVRQRRAAAAARDRNHAEERAALRRRLPALCNAGFLLLPHEREFSHVIGNPPGDVRQELIPDVPGCP